MKQIKPKYAAGQILGRITVRHVEGRSHSHPATPGKHLVKAQWWYETQCDCGNLEIVYQDLLRDRKGCNECTKQARYTVKKPDMGVNQADFVPFERMRWLENHTVGPFKWL